MGCEKITIRRYGQGNADQLLALIQGEGEEWTDYWQGSNWEKYQRALDNSVVYLIFEQDILCGYLRCRDDDGYGVYILDLLVDKGHRGKQYGRRLMEQVCWQFPKGPVYVMSDVNPYYEGLGYEAVGTIFLVKPQPPSNML